MKNISKLTAEKNKEPAYTLVRFKNWKKAPNCLKDHQNSNCHKEVATLAVIFNRQTKIGIYFISKNDERYNQFGRFTETDFI